MISFYKLFKFIIFSLMVYSTNVNASIKDAARLVDGCNEAVSIYNKKQEKKLWAGLTTSNSESLKAGYCIGVMEAYKSFGSIRTVRQSYECGRDSYYGYRNKTCYKNVEVNDCDNDTWFKMATSISKKWSIESKSYSASDLLNGICDG
jgi:hypothetical protein